MALASGQWLRVKSHRLQCCDKHTYIYQTSHSFAETGSYWPPSPDSHIAGAQESFSNDSYAHSVCDMELQIVPLSAGEYAPLPLVVFLIQ